MHTPSEQVLNHVIAWLGILLVVSVVGFGAYYYWDRLPGDTGPTALNQEIAKAEEAVRADPEALGPRIALGQFYYEAKRYRDSIDQFRAAVTIDDKNLQVHWGLGRALLASGDQAGAAQSFQVILDASKEADIKGDLVGSAYYYLGKIKLDQGKPDEAVEDIEAAVATDRSDADALYLLGSAYLAKGNFDRAIESLTKAARFVPDFGEAWGQLAAAYDGKGMGNEGRYARGMQLFSDGQLAKAAKELEATTAALPSFADGFVGLGLVREMQGQRDAAIAAYQRAIELEPNNWSALTGATRLGGATTTVDGAHGGGQ